MRHKCYQIDDFISPFFEEKEVTRLYDANLEPIYKIIKYGDYTLMMYEIASDSDNWVEVELSE